jgi:hypothetical protein
MNCDLNPVPVAGPVGAYVYRVTLQIAPVANRAITLQFATSSTAKLTKPRGALPPPPLQQIPGPTPTRR